ncbi:MAG: PEP-CTERM sorting domain-containing protein [Bryobacteraceae bacterium]
MLTYFEYDGNPYTTGTQVSGEFELGLDDLPGGASSGAAGIEVTPEPGGLALALLGLAGMMWYRRSLRARKA